MYLRRNDIINGCGGGQAPGVGAKAKKGGIEAPAGAPSTTTVLGPEYGHHYRHNCPSGLT